MFCTSVSSSANRSVMVFVCHTHVLCMSYSYQSSSTEDTADLSHADLSDLLHADLFSVGHFMHRKCNNQLVQAYTPAGALTPPRLFLDHPGVSWVACVMFYMPVCQRCQQPVTLKEQIILCPAGGQTDGFVSLEDLCDTDPPPPTPPLLQWSLTKPSRPMLR